MGYFINFLKKFNTNKAYLIYILCAVFVVLLGVLLRLKGFITNPSFWHDECNLGLSIIDYNLFDFFHKKLEYNQIAPPLLMFFTKILTLFFGLSERVFRFIPLIAGFGAIILFYFVSGYYLKTKFSRLIALIFFSISPLLIYYSNEFKQYEVDVFCTLVVIYLFNRLNFEKFDFKKILLSGIFCAILMWLSFVSGIITFAGIVYQVIISKNYKKCFIFCLPLLILGIIYVRLFLVQSYTGTSMTNLWDGEFVNRNFSNLLILFINSLQYFFAPIKNILFLCIFFIWGSVLFVKYKEVNSLILYFSIFTLLVLSWLKIYPFAERVILFILPIYLLIIFKPFELISVNKKTITIIIGLMFLLTFVPQILITGRYLKAKNSNKRDPAREFSKYLYENISNEDSIFVNIASNPEFEFYKHKYPLNNTVYKENPANNLKNTRVEDSIKIINNVKGNLWVYMPYDIPHRAVSKELSLYLQNNKKVIQNWQFGDAILMYVNIN